VTTLKRVNWIAQQIQMMRWRARSRTSASPGDGALERRGF
jgi:hypothetical protein